MHIDRESENMSRRAASMGGQQPFAGNPPNVFKSSASLSSTSVSTPTPPRHAASSSATSAPVTATAAPAATVKRDLKLTVSLSYITTLKLLNNHNNLDNQTYVY